MISQHPSWFANLVLIVENLKQSILLVPIGLFDIYVSDITWIKRTEFILKLLPKTFLQAVVGGLAMTTLVLKHKLRFRKDQHYH